MLKAYAVKSRDCLSRIRNTVNATDGQLMPQMKSIVVASLCAIGTAIAVMNDVGKSRDRVSDIAERVAQTDVWIERHAGRLDQEQGDWHWGNFELRRSRGPTFLITTYSSESVGAVDLIPLVFVVDTEDAFWSLMDVQSSTDRTAFCIDGKLMGKEFSRMGFSYKQFVNFFGPEPVRAKEELEITRYLSSSFEETQYQLADGRVFLVTAVADGGLPAIKQMNCSTPGKEVIRNLERFGLSDDDLYDAVSTWWQSVEYNR